MPDFRTTVRRRFASLRMTAGAESDLVEEVADHLSDLYQEFLAGGAGEEEARRRAIAELDDLYPLRASLGRRERMSSREWTNGAWKDFRYALRSLRKSPAFAVFVVLTLAVGIGANTTVFTLINTLILNPLPVRNAAELAAVAGVDAQGTARSAAFYPISYPDLEDYQQRNQSFRSLAGYTSALPMTLQDGGQAQGIFGELVTANYFDTLGLAPARGRFFAAGEDRAADPPPIAVLNYAAWQKRFGGAEDIVGRQLRVNGLMLTIIGVAPPHFIGVNAIFGPDLWAPAGLAGQLLSSAMRNALTDRAKASFLAVGRLKPELSYAQARANIETIADALARTYDAGQGRKATVRPLRDLLLSVNGSTASGMTFAGAALAAVVGIVLLIACSNVANLLLARSAARRQEMAVRLAIGATRGRLVRQMLTESVLLGLAAGGLGLALAYGGLGFLFGRLPAAANFPTPKLDGAVFLFTLFTSLATGLLFGMIPALRASNADVSEALKESGRAAGRTRRRATVANALLVAQVAFSFVLLTTAALFLRSIGHAYAIDPGFQTARLAVFPSSPGQAGYGKSQTRAYYREARDRTARLPGVESVSWASNMPLWGRSAAGIVVPGRVERSRADQVRAVVNTVDRDYFETAGVSLLAGRAFTAADTEDSLPVAIVNEKFARDYWPEGALGRRVQLPGEANARQVVGVARTANYTSWGEAPQGCVYVPLAQHDSDSMVLYVRTRSDPREILVPVERELRAAAPGVLLLGIRTGAEVIDGGLFQARMGVGLLTVFGLLALGLASIGLYGVLAYTVNQRRREIGLRMAMGAGRGNVMRLVLGEGMKLVLAGLLLGFAVSAAAGRLLSRMLFGVKASDPTSLVGAAAVLALAALVACYLPARSATRVDPLDTLREV